MDQKLQELLTKSRDIEYINEKLTIFFNNSSMARLLDVFLDHSNVKITIMDLLDRAQLSRKAIVSSIPFLLKNNMISEEQHGFYKFYKLNTKNKLVKQITEFRNNIIVNNGGRKQQETEKN